MLDLRVASGGGELQTFGVTGDHPFWTRGSGWVHAAQLEKGQRVLTSKGRWATVAASAWRPERKTVHNLEVEGFHTYFVGRPAVWVHNDCDDIEFGEKGKMHGEVPSHPPNASTSELKELKRRVKDSIERRKTEMQEYGEEARHRRRLGEEERFLHQIKNRLEDR